MTEEKWNLPHKFAPSPDKLAEWDAQQSELKTKITIRTKTPREILFDNALIRINELNNLLDDKTAPFNTFMARVLAENYATVGNFEAATFHEPTVELAAEYEAIRDCLQRKDQARCGCLASADYQTNVATVQEIYHEKLARFVELQKCVMCSRLTIKF